MKRNEPRRTRSLEARHGGIPGGGLEPPCLAAHDFESCASTSSASPARAGLSICSRKDTAFTPRVQARTRGILPGRPRNA
jgi:hypothetical protein